LFYDIIIFSSVLLLVYRLSLRFAMLAALSQKLNN